MRRGDGHGLSTDKTVVELLGEVGGAVVGDAGRPTDRERHAGRHERLTQPGRRRLRGPAPIEEHAPHPVMAAPKNLGDDRGRLARVGPPALVFERERAHARTIDRPVTGQVDDVRAAFGDQFLERIEASRLGEVDAHVLQPGDRPEHGVLLALVVELGLVGRGRRQKEDSQRPGPERAAGLQPARQRRPAKGPRGVAPDRSVRVELDEFPGEVQHLVVRTLDNQPVRARRGQPRLDGAPGGLEPGREAFPAHRAKGVRFGERAAPLLGLTALLEQPQESPAQVRDRPDRRARDRDRPPGHLAVHEPSAIPARRRVVGFDPEREHRHRLGPSARSWRRVKGANPDISHALTYDTAG